VRIQEFAAEKGWTIKEVAERSGVGLQRSRFMFQSPGLATADATALQKLARTLDRRFV